MSKQTEISIQRRSGLVDVLAIQQQNPSRYPFLLQSTANGEANDNARYDVLFAFPGERLRLNSDDVLSGPCSEDSGHDFLNALDAWWRQAALPTSLATEEALPFTGGWFLYLGYELAEQIETRLHLPKFEMTQPIAEAVRIPAAIINDRQRNKTVLVAERGAAALISQLEQDIARSPEVRLNADVEALTMQPDPEPRYLSQVEQVKRYIYEGDVFQVNLSRKWQGPRPASLNATAIYEHLRRTNPAPFAGLAYLEGLTIISSSPERLVRQQADIVETRPIAGTRPRSSASQQDIAFKSELIAHPKERAEHIMLIDLERNDLGRVCAPGSIEVNELMTVESYAHVHHIVSNVRGRLREGTSPAQVIRAVFPGGTITGCPKERCMAIIAELEQEARGAYTGSMGYLNHNGDMDLNILIRSITLDDNRVTIRAGAGLVADSDPERELQETHHKARGMLLAVGAEP